MMNNIGYEISDEEIYEILKTSGINYQGKVYIGLCLGVLVNEVEMNSLSYEKYTFLKYDIYYRLQKKFKVDNVGVVIRKENNYCSMIGVIAPQDMESFLCNYLAKIKDSIKTERGLELLIGVGIPTEKVNLLKNSYHTAKFAYNYYFFEQNGIIDYTKIKQVESLSFDVYEELLEEVYRSIVAKDKSVYEKIEKVLGAIGLIHYGDKYKVVNRCIMFIGELGKKLKDLNPVAANWRIEQEEMQEQLRYQSTFESVCDIILSFYRHLIPIIYHNVEKGNVYEIIEIREYIQKNYMKDISLKDMSDILCVSPTYFSTFFKNATGKNFKTYLTEVRMEEALKLVLRTSKKTYEISEEVGYNNVRRFVEAFKSIYKMSPMEYRKVHENEKNK